MSPYSCHLANLYEEIQITVNEFFQIKDEMKLFDPDLNKSSLKSSEIVCRSETYLIQRDPLSIFEVMCNLLKSFWNYFVRWNSVKMVEISERSWINFRSILLLFCLSLLEYLTAKVYNGENYCGNKKYQFEVIFSFKPWVYFQTLHGSR
jgi:hypothetical protein